MNKYEAYLDRGRLFALDLDTSEQFQVRKNGLKVFSSLKDDECPYEIYTEDDLIYCINLNNGDSSLVELIRV